MCSSTEYASGALDKLTYLNLAANVISDAGMSALASACASGALDKLTLLSLHTNAIGDAGLQALADALSKGRLASLMRISVDTTHERHPQLVAACQPRGIEIV